MRDLCLIGKEEYLFRHSEPSEPVKTSSEGWAILSSYDVRSTGAIEMLHRIFTAASLTAHHLTCPSCLPPFRDICMHACIHERLLNLNMFFFTVNSH